MSNTKNIRNISIVVLLLILTVLSCGKGKKSSTSGTVLESRTTLTVDGVSLRVFDESGVPIGNPAEQYSLALAPEADGRSVIVATKTKLNSTACYLELRFNAAKEHPANIQAGSAMQEYNPLVYTGSPEAGVVIAAQVIPGAKSDRFSGELLKLKLLPGKHNLRHSSGFEQDPVSDPILAETSVDPTNPNKFYWTLKLRGDGNANQIFDFADFGVIGAKYNKAANEPGCEVADANNKGKVDFADFGIVGANYNKGIGGLKIWRDDNTEPTKLQGTLSFTSKLKGDFTHNPVDSQIQTSGFKHFWHTSSNSGQNYKISLLDLSGSEIPGHSDVFNTSKTKAGPGDWWMFGREPTHNRRSPYIGPKTNALKWKFKTGGAIYSSPAIDADGTVYVGCRDNYLYAVKSNGELKWKLQTSDDVDSSPAIGADGSVYVGSYDDYLYVINSDGSLRYKYKTGSNVTSSPAIAPDGSVYVGSCDDYFYSHYPNGSLKWRFKTNDIVTSSPIITCDGSIFVGSYDNCLYSLNQDGSLKWKHNTGNTLASSPAIGFAGYIFIGNKDKNLYAFYSNGTNKWKLLTGSMVYCSPALGADGSVFFGSEDNYLYSVNLDSTLEWKQLTGSKIYSSPAIGADGTVYFGSEDCNFYAISSDNTIKWIYLTGDTIKSSPAIGDDGTVYFGSFDTYLYAIGPGDGKSGLLAPENVAVSDSTYSDKIQVTWLAPSSGPAPDGYYVYRALDSNGVWMYAGMTATTTFNDTYPESGKTYYYKVQSYKYASGYNDSGFSSIDSGSK